MDQSDAARVAMQNRETTKSALVLMGIVTGIIADGELHSMEIQMLNTWLSANQAVAATWPGSAIAKHLREILADGIITQEEKAHFLQTLQKLAGEDFADTGSVSPEVAGLPYDHSAPIQFKASNLCLTGEFLYGTRTACEKLCEQMGAMSMPSVSKKVHYLVVGTHVSKQWVNTSYGRKIQKAMELKSDGHGIYIIPERLWIDSLKAM